MDEETWRSRARAVLLELDTLALTPDERTTARREIEAALVLPRGSARAALREALTAWPAICAWLRARGDAGGDIVRGAPRGSLAGTRLDRPDPTVVGPTVDAADDSAALDGGSLGGMPQAAPPDDGPAPADDPPTAGAQPPAQQTVHALLDAPESVSAGSTLVIRVGLTTNPSPRVLSPDGLLVPTTAFTLTVTLMLSGFELCSPSSPVVTMQVTPEQPLPWVDVHVQATDGPQFARARTVLAEYSIDGRVLGVATTSVDVRPRGEAAPVSAPATHPPQAWSVASAESPDVVVTIAPGNDEEGLTYLVSAQTPHAGIPGTAAPLALELGGDADEWARQLMRGAEGQSGAALKYFIQGIQTEIGDCLPDEVWAVIAAVADKVPHPTVLINTAEPYIPWELAEVPHPWDDQRPALLGAQATVGRWIYRDQGRTASPVTHLTAASMAVVRGTYSGNQKLLEAEREADDLRTLYGAEVVEAELLPVMTAITGPPGTDVLHFAVHGKLDATGVSDGLLLTDRTYLSPVSILGARDCSSPIVFLNACQVGQQQEMLGRVGGVVPAFLRIGAQAVVAPLWKVDDQEARAFAARFYLAVTTGTAPAEFMAAERARAGADPAGPNATVLAYLYFGHPRLVVTSTLASTPTTDPTTDPTTTPGASDADPLP